VSAYCGGGTLAEWLRNLARPFSVRLAATLTARLADGVQHAHDQGILHRDIKPSNILLDTAAGKDPRLHDQLIVPRLTDFGLARLADQDGPVAAASQATHPTRSGAVLGTPAYMAPEQADGRLRDLGPATDVYALGAILYEMLTGLAPFRGETDLAILQRV